MRILILSQHFFPEVTAARFRIVAIRRGDGWSGTTWSYLRRPQSPGESSSPGTATAIVREQIHGAQVSTPGCGPRSRRRYGPGSGSYGSCTGRGARVGAVTKRPDVVLEHVAARRLQSAPASGICVRRGKAQLQVPPRLCGSAWS